MCLCGLQTECGKLAGVEDVAENAAVMYASCEQLKEEQIMMLSLVCSVGETLQSK